MPSSVLFAFILGFGSCYNYANGQNTFSVFTDRSTYNVGDIVIVSGTVPTVTANVPVNVQLLNPANLTHSIDQQIPADGRYYLEFKLVGELVTAGNWTVRVTFAAQEVYKYFFVFPEKTGHLFQVKTDKDLYVGDEVITVSGTVPYVRGGLIVSIFVYEPNFDFPAIPVYSTEIVPTSDGTYTTNFTSLNFTIDPSLIVEGMHTVRAEYDDEVPAETTFDYLRETRLVKINSHTPDEPRWGLDPVNVAGTVINPPKRATIVVEWGDGTSDLGILLSDNTWSAANHIYDAKHVGENKIIATLYEGLPIEINAELYDSKSEPYSVNVIKHSTNLTLEPINEPVDKRFSVSGRLYDIDAERGISDKKIIVRVSTTDLVTTVALTDSNGYYKSSGSLSGDLSADKLLFHTNFVGDDFYFASNSYERLLGEDLYLGDVNDMRTITGEEITNGGESTGGEEIPPVVVIPPIVAAAATITLMNVPKPKPKPKIRKDASTVITLQVEVDIKRE